MADKYNGWANYQTWNVALWIGNDEGLYSIARETVRYERKAPYLAFVSQMHDLGMYQTPDGVAWNDSGIDLDELDGMMRELGPVEYDDEDEE